MRVQLEVGDHTVDVENNMNPYPTAEQDQMFFDLLKGALQSVGYSELDMLVYLTGANKHVEKKSK